jgi:hypothetical protein
VLLDASALFEVPAGVVELLLEAPAEDEAAVLAVVLMAPVVVEVKDGGGVLLEASPLLEVPASVAELLDETAAEEKARQARRKHTDCAGGGRRINAQLARRPRVPSPAPRAGAGSATAPGSAGQRQCPALHATSRWTSPSSHRSPRPTPCSRRRHAIAVCGEEAA